MEPHSFRTTSVSTTDLGYLFYLPPDYGTDPAVRWPLILFLHGHGESGTNLDAVRRHGIPRIVAEQPDFPFVAVAPQCPWGTWWPELAVPLLALLDDIMSRYTVDSDRVYLTGLSMGGYGTWYLGARHAARFAAIAPICGGGYWFHGFPQQVCALRGTPVWAFHGAQDDLVPLRESETLVDTLRQCGGTVELTVYPDAGHDSWTATYANPALYQWFLAHPRTAPGVAERAAS